MGSFTLFSLGGVSPQMFVRLFLIYRPPVGGRLKALRNHPFTISTIAPYFLGSQGKSETGSILHTEPRHIHVLSTKVTAQICAGGQSVLADKNVC
jgi:hypothetical protein